MHGEALQYVHRKLGEWRSVHGWSAQSVLDIGALDINGTTRYLFAPPVHYLGVDLQTGRGVDLVLDAAADGFLGALAVRELMTIEEDQLWPGFDLVVCTEVLEHAEHAERIVRNAWRALGVGGLCVITCAADPRAPHSMVDGGAPRPGEFYRNLTRDELWDMLAPFVTGKGNLGWREVAYDDRRGDLYAFAVKASPVVDVSQMGQRSMR